MKIFKPSNSFIKRSYITGFAGVFSAMTNIAAAGDLDIATNALEVANGAEPNVMILNDDSGSMDWTILATDDQGTYFITNQVTGIFGNFNFNTQYLYINPDGDNADDIFFAGVPFGFNPGQSFAGGLTDFFTIPTENAILDFNNTTLDLDAAGYTNWRGVWRARTHHYNSSYYNPDVEYLPWEGSNNNNVVYSDVTPSSAPVDPYLSLGPAVDLTVSNGFTSNLFVNNITNFNSANDFFFSITDTIYPPSYYEWVDTNDNNEVDEDDEHKLIQIRDNTTCSTYANVTVECPTSFSRAGTRTDCGGDGESESTTTCSASQELQNFANWYSYYRRRELTSKAAITRVLEPQSAVRVGIATINNVANNRIPVESLNVSPFSGAKKDLFDAIYETQSSGGTPLRQNLAAVGEYFACNTGNIFGTGGSAPGSANCPVEAAPAGTCQQNYAILMTDGFYNGASPGIGNTDGGASTSDFDGASFADGHSNTLADVAMHYYERDLHSTTLDDNVEANAREIARYTGPDAPLDTMHQHMVTYTVGFGVEGSLSDNPSDVNAAFNWPDPTDGNDERIDDLRHAAWNGRGDFLSANNQEDLTESLAQIFREIGTGRGAASAVAFNTQDIQSGSLVFRAFFNTDNNSGNLIAQDVSLTGEIDILTNRWEANQMLESIIDDDARQVISFNSETNVGIPFQFANLNQSQKDALGAPASTVENIDQKRLDYIRGSRENEIDGTDPDKVFRVRPDLTREVNQETGQLENTFTGGRLGDFIHSAPRFAGSPPFQGRDNLPYPDTTGELYSEFAIANANRNGVVYIGGNDGMLHAFDTDTGSEIFAYVPDILIGDLPELTDPDYLHRFYVDVTPTIQDVYMQMDRGTNALDDAWNTVLVSGLGVGAPGYFAMNITDPSALSSETTAPANVMWEFTQDDDDNLGLPISSPLVAMSNIQDESGNNRWVVIFGNGYNSGSEDGNAELYILFIDEGQDGTWLQGTDFFKISTGNGREEDPTGTDTPNGLGAVRGIDVDGNGTIDAVYAGDYQGNVYRFNLSGTTIEEISGSTTRVQTLFTATYDSERGGDNERQPITNRPIVIEHPSEPGFIVLVGTGSFFTNDDITAPKSEQIQSIYGLWDNFSISSDIIDPVDPRRLQEQTFSNSATTINGFTVRTLTDNSFRWGTTGQSKQGWVIDLDVPGTSGTGAEFPGEKAIRNFLLRGNFVFVNTVVPKSNTACTVGVGGFELAFNPETGGAGETVIFDVNNDGNFDANDNVGGGEASENIITGIRFDKSTPTDSSFIGNRKVTQTSDRDIRNIGTNTISGQALGRHSWREITL